MKDTVKGVALEAAPLVFTALLLIMLCPPAAPVTVKAITGLTGAQMAKNLQQAQAAKK